MSDGTQGDAIGEDAPARLPRRGGREAPLATGDVLNGIYQVARFIARGGMGEVFEGFNVESEERVAIKAIRSHLADDPKIIALFRKEARVLTHISHPAIVQYRVFARDPLLDLHYIVTDFIDGAPITAYLDGNRPSIADVVTLARRLAAGLQAAHDHGAIHRDMSPDNVLLPAGKIERAKIIDFGIAKSLELGAETVVGEGFAGKLGYVAPEQFGDFGRQIGPWTDVYSTALVLMAYARGKAPNMGVTLSEAVERRRAGPDVSDLPALAPLLRRMTLPDPASRIRSMRDVLIALEGIDVSDGVLVAAQPRRNAVSGTGGAHSSQETADREAEVASRAAPDPTMMTTFAPAPEPARAGEPADGSGRAAPAQSRAPVVATGKSGLGPDRPSGRARRLLKFRLPALGLLSVGALVLHHAPDVGRAPAPPSQRSSPPPPAAAAQLPAAERATSLGTLVADIPCTWVNARATTENGPTMLAGGAGNLGAIKARLTGHPQALGVADMTEIQPVNVTQCGAVDALRPFHIQRDDRDANDLRLSASNIRLGEGNQSCPRAGTAEISVAKYDPRTEFALILLQSDGQLLQITATREEFAALAKKAPDRFNIGADGAYHASVCYALTGSSAIFLIESNGAVDLGLRSGVATLPPADFAERVAEQGRAQHMRILAQWIRVDGVATSAGAADSAVATTSVVPAGSRQPSDPKREAVNKAVRTLAAKPVDAADANRLELARITALNGVLASASSTPTTCRAFDGQWKDIGLVGHAECIVRAFRGRCQIRFAQYKRRLIRREGEHLQEQRGGRWIDVAIDSGC